MSVSGLSEYQVDKSLFLVKKFSWLLSKLFVVIATHQAPLPEMAKPRLDCSDSFVGVAVGVSSLTTSYGANRLGIHEKLVKLAHNGSGVRDGGRVLGIGRAAF